MSSFQRPAIGSKNIARDPELTIRLLPENPTNLRNLNPPMTPNELVGVFNGFDGTIRLFMVSADGENLIQISSA